MTRIRASDLVVAGVVDRRDADARTLAVLGVAFRVGARTQLEDTSAAGVRAFSLDDLQVGDFVDVRAVAAADGTGDARRVAREERAGRRERLRIDGALDAIDVAGVRVSGVQLGFSDRETVFVLDGRSVSKSAFLASVAAGERVELEAVAGTAGALRLERIEAGDGVG